MMCKPLRDWREVARDLRGQMLECGRFLPAEAPEAIPRDLRRFHARV